MSNKECPICYEKIGKIYKELECGHRYHFRCITLYEKLKDNNDLNCPYCRKEYSVMKLRVRIPNLTPKELKRKSEFSNNIKSLLNKIEFEFEKSQKIIVINTLFSYIISNVNMIKDIKFGLKPKFLNVVLLKLSELSLDVNNVYNKKQISKKDYEKYYSNKIKIENEFNIL